MSEQEVKLEEIAEIRENLRYAVNMSPLEQESKLKQIAEIYDRNLSVIQKEFDNIKKEEREIDKGLKEFYKENSNIKSSKKTFDDYFECFNDTVSGLFLSDNNEAFVTINIKGHQEHKQIDSEFVKNRILITCFNNGLGAPSKDIIAQISNTLKAMCLSQEIKKEVNLRYAYKNNKLYVDLCRSDWKILEISKEEIKIIDSEDIIFERFNHMKEIKPILNANIEDINLYAKNFELSQEDILMSKIELITSFLPHIPRTIDQTSASMGSGKSVFTKQMRSICDPSQLEVLIFPENEQELLLQARQNAFIPYDNMRFINHRMSDLMCSIATGVSFSKRKLYTDSESIIEKLMRKIVLNGINRTGNNSDFGDRSVELKLKRIKPSKRKSESELRKDFEIDKPKIQGACFKIIQEAIKIIDTIKINELPRMADYCIWGEAISRVLGNEKGYFVKIYFEKINNLSDEILETNDIAKALLIFANQKQNWEGTTTDLFREINKIATNVLFIDIRLDKTWIKNSVVLGKKINEFEPLLETKGVLISRKKTNGMRLIKIVSSNNNSELKKDSKILSFIKENNGHIVTLNSVNDIVPNKDNKEELNKLKESGLIFEPKENYFQLL